MTGRHHARRVRARRAVVTIVGLVAITVLSFVLLPAVANGPGGATTTRSATASPPPSARRVRLAVSLTGDGAVTSMPVGVSCPGTCSASFAEGTPVRLRQSSSSGSHFLQWGGACAGMPVCRIRPDTDESVTAEFPPDVAPLSRDVARYVASRSDQVGVAVYDARSGTTFVLDARGGFECGSIVKVQIMGTVLQRAQQEHRNRSSFEASNMVPMIEESDNDAATNLWNEVGGTVGVEGFDHDAGMQETTTDLHWGLTLTTAWDNVRLVRTFAYPNAVLTTASRRYGLNLMEHVADDERWGVSAGPGVEDTVALKNGWLPLPDDRAWRINSIGWVHGDGRNYVIAVLTDHNPSMSYGVDTVETVSRMVWNELGPAA